MAKENPENDKNEEDAYKNAEEKVNKIIKEHGLFDEQLERKPELKNCMSNPNKEPEQEHGDDDANDTFIMNFYAHPVEKFMLDRPDYFKRVS